MIWIFTAIALLAWLAGVLLRLGQWVNLFLVAAVLLVISVIDQRSADHE